MPIEILVIDDEKIVGQRLKASLEKDGYSVETFTEPLQALERIREKKFDVVVTDIRMDNLDGITMLEETRKKSEKTKVVIITGYATLEIAREALTKGAFDFISKPFKLKEIREAILKAVEALQLESS